MGGIEGLWLLWSYMCCDKIYLIPLRLCNILVIPPPSFTFLAVNWLYIFYSPPFILFWRLLFSPLIPPLISPLIPPSDPPLISPLIHPAPSSYSVPWLAGNLKEPTHYLVLWSGLVIVYTGLQYYQLFEESRINPK